jgi:hypothetical protein
MLPVDELFYLLLSSILVVAAKENHLKNHIELC